MEQWLLYMVVHKNGLSMGLELLHLSTEWGLFLRMGFCSVQEANHSHMQKGLAQETLPALLNLRLWKCWGASQDLCYFQKLVTFECLRIKVTGKNNSTCS